MNNVTFVVAIVLACFILSMLSERLTPEYSFRGGIDRDLTIRIKDENSHDKSTEPQWNNYYDKIVDMAEMRTPMTALKKCFASGEDPGFDPCTQDEKDNIQHQCWNILSCRTPPWEYPHAPGQPESSFPNVKPCEGPIAPGNEDSVRYGSIRLWSCDPAHVAAGHRNWRCRRAPYGGQYECQDPED